jgi:thymidylate synthase
MRLRRYRGLDQIARAYLVLRSNPSSRQVVLQVWDAAIDLPSEDGKPRSSDVPCNLISSLKVRQGRLEWMQIVRSNDIDRGVPHNLIQFTMLHELMAGWLGLEVGSYVHVMDSVHWYPVLSHRMGIDDDVMPAQNTDRLQESFEDSMHAFSLIGELMGRIIEARKERRHLAFIQGARLARPYANILAIVAADDARRHGEEETANRLAAQCDNPALRQSWERWRERAAASRRQVVANIG